MVICSVDVLKMSSKKKETGIEKEIVKILQQASDLKRQLLLLLVTLKKSIFRRELAYSYMIL